MVNAIFHNCVIVSSCNTYVSYSTPKKMKLWWHHIMRHFNHITKIVFLLKGRLQKCGQCFQAWSISIPHWHFFIPPLMHVVISIRCMGIYGNPLKMCANQFRIPGPKNMSTLHAYVINYPLHPSRESWCYHTRQGLALLTLKGFHQKAVSRMFGFNWLML